MNNFAITAADAVSRRYKSNDPEAIIAQRAIKIKDIRFCEELLGFYTVLLNCEYIGIKATTQIRTGPRTWARYLRPETCGIRSGFPRYIFL